MAKRKKIGHGDITGDKGIALIHRIVLDMGFVWHATNLDAGIDGYIELRDPESGEVSNCILQVQSKAGPSWFKNETNTSFDFTCNERDLEYWLAGNAPVILVVSRPDDDEAYWVSFKDYFRDAERRKTKKVTFDKRADRFDALGRTRLAQLAIPEDSGLYLSALPRSETLVSNLLPLTGFPKRLFRAATKLRFPGQVWEKLREDKINPVQSEWVLHDGHLYSFHDLTFAPWRKVCIPTTTENLAATDWANSENNKQRYVFVRLLNLCLSELLYRQNIRYSKAKDYYYFRAAADLTPRKLGRVTVFKGYESKTTKDRIAYYRHHALTPRFVRHGDSWFIEITHTYHFTQDGYKISRFHEERLKGIKQLEKQNKGHLSRIRLWASVLDQSLLDVEPPTSVQQNLFGPPDEPEAVPIEPYPHLQFGQLVQFDVDFGIDDAGWLPTADESSEYEDPLQRRLFE